jgi:hypothetical protein
MLESDKPVVIPTNQMAVILPISNRNCWRVRLTQLTPPCEDDYVISDRIRTTDIALNHDGKNYVMSA